MSRLNQLLGSGELKAHQGLTRACKGTETQVFPKMKLSDVLQLKSSGLTRDEFVYATRAHIDFVINRANLPYLAIETDFIPKRGKCLDQADLKDRICADLGLPLVRVSFEHLLNDEEAIIDSAGRIIDEWDLASTHALSNRCVVYRGCLFHDTDCALAACSEFGKLAAVILGSMFHEELIPEVIPAEILFATWRTDDGYFLSDVSLLWKGMEANIGWGMCRTPPTLLEFGQSLSKRLALSHASALLRSIRNNWNQGEPCYLDFAKDGGAIVELPTRIVQPHQRFSSC